MKYTDYLKAAFLSQLNLVLLGGLGLFSLVAWNILPITIGLVGEIVYLAIVPTLPSYHSRLEKKALQELQEKQADEHKKILSSLPSEARDEYQRLITVSEEIRKNYQQLHPTTQNFLDTITKQLDNLLKRYLRMKQAYARSEQYLSSTTEMEVSSMLQEVSVSLEQNDERLHEVQEKQKKILEMRLEKRKKAEDNARILKTQIDTVEQFILLMKDQSFTLRDPNEISGQIDSMMSEVKNTESTVRELETFFTESEI